MRTIEAVHMGSDKKYGSPKVAERLVCLAFAVNESTVARRMKKHASHSKLKKKFKATTKSDVRAKHYVIYRDHIAISPSVIVSTFIHFDCHHLTFRLFQSQASIRELLPSAYMVHLRHRLLARQMS